MTNYGPNQLFRNHGDGTFGEVASTAGVDSRRWGSGAGFFDFDRDGDLDLYVVNYLDYDPEDNPYCGLPKEGYRLYCDIRMFEGAADQLFRNNGNGSFSDVSSSAGIANPAGKGLGLTFSDFDRDGYPDIYVANDTIRDFLYRNNRDGNFLRRHLRRRSRLRRQRRTAGGNGCGRGRFEPGRSAGDLRHEFRVRTQCSLPERSRPSL